MNASLKNHPFSVEAFFKNSFVLTFALPKEQLNQLIPECLELDLFNDTWGFLAIAMVQTKALRPKGFPVFMGNDFFLIGYRVFVKYTTSAGKRLRGLYIIKSETNKKKMQVLGNIFTHYSYTTTDILHTENSEEIIISSLQSNFHVKIDRAGEDIDLPLNSPFTKWGEARRFAGPLPYTFTYNSKTKEVLIIEGVRQHWKPQPLKVIEYNFSFLDSPTFNGAVLANAFVISNIPYSWKKGKIDQWKG